MPKIGFFAAISSRSTGTAYSPVAAGSPGPFDRKTPSGRWRRISSLDVAVGGSLASNRQGRPSGMESRQADDPARFQPAVERLFGAIVRRLGRQAAHDEAARRRRRRLDVLAVGADIADMREGEGDDL